MEYMQLFILLSALEYCSGKFPKRGRAKDFSGSEIFSVERVNYNGTEKAFTDSSWELPEFLHFKLHHRHHSMMLNLKRSKPNHFVNAPVFVIRNGSLVREILTRVQNARIYHDFGGGGTVYVKCDINLENGCNLRLDGTFIKNGKEYAIHYENLGEKPFVVKNENLHILEKSKQKSWNCSSQMKEIFKRKKIFGTSRNEPRQPHRKYSVELLVVVDYSIYRTWFNRTLGDTLAERRRKTLRTIRDIYTHVVRGINAKFRTLKEVNFTLGITLVGLVIIDIKNDQVWTEMTDNHQTKNGDFSKILDLFENWIQSQQFLPSHDHSMLFITHELENATTINYNGYSHPNTMCTHKSVSVVQDKFDFISTVIAAHQLGHSLGVHHDGDNNSCTQEYTYIMSASGTSETQIESNNHWTFSSCSSHYISKYITKLLSEENQCLVSYGTSTASQKSPGEILAADLQCKQIFGKSSYVCRTFHNASFKSICSGLWCSLGSAICDIIIPADGTPCGKNKWCKTGKCVKGQGTTGVTDDCPFGDQIGPLRTNLTCAQISKARLWECYKSDVAQACCYTCPVTHCDGGLCCKNNDRGDDCLELPSFACYSPDITKLCCKTCRVHCSKSISGCECGDKRGGCHSIARHKCYKDEGACCETCHNMKDPNNKECPYGDQLPGCKSIDRQQCYNFTIRNTCCETCARLMNTTMSGCEYGDRNNLCQARECSLYDDHTVSQICCETCHVIVTVVSSHTGSYSPLERNQNVNESHSSQSSILANIPSIVCYLQVTILMILH